MVEFALVLPVVVLLLGVCFTGWNTIHGAIGLTGAARAGAIVAGVHVNKDCPITAPSPPPLSDCAPVSPMPTASEIADVKAAIEGEENTTGFVHVPVGSGASCANKCFTLSEINDPTTGEQFEVVSVYQRLDGSIPFMPALVVTATSTAAP